MKIRMYTFYALCALFAFVAARESFNTTPPPISSDFSCTGRSMGFYADVGTNCRAYHMCDDHGNHFTHYCPEDTAFRQDAMICDHAYLVDCQANVDKAPARPLFDQDVNHDAPPSSFVEPRGEGTHARGYARSFRINPDPKSSTSSKYPTFVLNSSVFLTNRDSNVIRPTTSRRFQEPESKSSKTKFTPKDNTKTNGTLAFISQENHNSLSATPRIIISENLEPPLESPRKSKEINHFSNDEFSFLVPPLVKNDNNYFQKDSNKPLKNVDSRIEKILPGSFKINDNNNFEESGKPVTFNPRTKMILEMLKARGLGRETHVDDTVATPATFLEPPIFKLDSQVSSRSNFNFRNDDYPYVETLRSIQNNKASVNANPVFNSAPSTKFDVTTISPTQPGVHSTEALIFAIPTKPLLSGGDTEQDPYYPKSPVTTEAYYTQRDQVNKLRKPHYTTTRKPSTSNPKFQIPDVLPDLNSLEDLLDRRKFFFIPQIRTDN